MEEYHMTPLQITTEFTILQLMELFVSESVSVVDEQKIADANFEVLKAFLRKKGRLKKCPQT